MLQTPMKWILLTQGCFVQFLYQNWDHYKLTQTKRATWQNSDVWTLWTKIMIYSDKYHFVIGIHNKNESQNDCLQFTLFTHFTVVQNWSLCRCWSSISRVRWKQTQKSLSCVCVCVCWGNQNIPSALPSRKSLPSQLWSAHWECFPSEEGHGAGWT